MLKIATSFFCFLTFSQIAFSQADPQLSTYRALQKAASEIQKIDSVLHLNSKDPVIPHPPEPCGHRKFNPAAFDTHQQAMFEEKLQKLQRVQEAKINARGMEVLQIPVVVHVIHQGQNPGMGENISEAQIGSQIRALNEAFNRTPGSHYSTTENNAGLNYGQLTSPAEIEFVLASIDPQGIPTNGINRVEAQKNYHLIPDFVDEIIKPATIWNPDYYLNLWSVRLTDGTQPGLLGYAVFPTMSGLEGLDFYVNPSSDGIVCDFRTVGSNAFGSIFDLNPAYQFGVVAIHEVGHFLGLRHIWGDGDTEDVGCSVDDFVDDTPNAAFRSSSCEPNQSCNSIDLNENYMDYGSDQCKNLFTNGQILRMITVLTNSPRRASLVQSPVLQGQAIPSGLVPSNDLCSDALPISCGNTFSGTTENSTPNGVFTGLDGRLCSGTPATSGIWFSFLGEGNQITLKTSGPDTKFDATVHVFQGNCNELTCIGGNDDGSSLFSNSGSDLIFLAESGVTYLIYVSGREGETGTFSLSVQCESYSIDDSPPNDHYQNATEITCGAVREGSTTRSTIDAITSGTCGIELSDKGLWYKYVGTGELVTVSTCTQSAFDTRLAIFTGSESFWYCSGQNDNGGCGKGSLKKFLGLEGITYLIWIGGSEVGDFTLTLTCEPAPDAPVDLFFAKQSQVDSFGLLYPGTKEILGDVTIQHDLAKSTIIHNLSPLKNINQIGGNLVIRGNIYDAFDNLDGLDSLTEIGGDLVIENNAPLASLDGLSSLVSIGGDLLISGFSISSLEPFSNLKSVGGGLSFFGRRINRGPIKNFLAFNTLESVGSDIIINGWRTIDTLVGFNQIATIPGDLEIEDNWSGVSKTGISLVSGFEALAEVGGEVVISHNDGLIEIDQFPALKTIGKHLELVFNQAQNQLNTFNSLQSLGGDFRASFLNVTKIEGFNLLDSIYGKIYLRFLDLEDLSGFNQLKYIGDSLILISALGNEQIENAFENLTQVGKTILFDFNLEIPFFSGLNQLKSIGEDLIISKFNRADTIDGFSNLRKIEGTLLIDQNIFNKHVGNFGELQMIGKNLEIVNNSNLLSIGGLHNLTSIKGSLMLKENHSLARLTLPGLLDLEGDLSILKSNGITVFSAETLGSIGGDFTIDRFNFNLDTLDLPALTSVEDSFVFDSSGITKAIGIENLSSVGGDFIPSRSLFNFENLNITNIGGDFILDTMFYVRDLHGLESLQKIDGNFALTRSRQLTNLEALKNLLSIGGDILISNNSTLSDCSGICNAINAADGTSNFDIYDNGDGCNDIDALLDLCAITPAYVSNDGLGVNIFPNPFSQAIYLRPDNYQVERFAIYDMTGSLRFSESPHDIDLITVPMEYVPPGMYLINIYLKNGPLISKKMIKE